MTARELRAGDRLRYKDVWIRIATLIGPAPENTDPWDVGHIVRWYCTWDPPWPGDAADDTICCCDDCLTKLEVLGLSNHEMARRLLT